MPKQDDIDNDEGLEELVKKLQRYSGNGSKIPVAPTREEASGLTAGGAVGILLIWYLTSQGIAVDPLVAGAIGTLAGQIVGYITSFLPKRPSK